MGVTAQGKVTQIGATPASLNPLKKIIPGIIFKGIS